MSLREGSVIYQGYPASMPDRNGDGIGDFAGIQQVTLPYLSRELGVDGLWLSPFYRSPWRDGGYDISDHTGVNPMHGTMEEAVAMIEEANRQRIDIIADLVPCASSDQHPEFQRALQDPANDSYVFVTSPHPAGIPPNNWRSVFPHEVRNHETGDVTRLPESAWRLVHDYWPHAAPERLDQWVFTNFAAHQPNWNYADPAVRERMRNVARFWLERGVKGFRVDSVDYLDHDRSLPSEPLNPGYTNETHLPVDQLDRIYSMRGPQNLAYLRELASVVTEFPGSYMMFEAYPNRFKLGNNVAEHYAQYYNAMDDELRGRVAPFCFEIIGLPWEAQQFKTAIDGFQAGLKPGDVPIYPGGNHDSHRLASRYGERAARAAIAMQLALPGIAVIYQGDELGMTNHTGIPQHLRSDPYVDRDVSRTPVPEHGDDPRTGFSELDPDHFRFPIHPEYRRFNIRTQQRDADSVWHTTHRSIQERRASPTLQHGGYAPLDTDDEQVYGFVRTGQRAGEHYISITNFASEPTTVGLGHLAARGALLLKSSGALPFGPMPISLERVAVGPEETVLIRPR